MIKLVGILIVIVGFALKMDSIAIVLGAGLVTGLVGGLGITEILDIFGKNFVANRTMCIFIVIMLVTGTLERNGLQIVAANMIKKFKNASSGLIVAIYGILVSVFGAFNTGIGGVAGFIRPVMMPMSEGTIIAKYGKVNEDHLETVKGMSAGMGNIAWFFSQVLFVGGSGGLLVQSTLNELGYQVDLLTMAKVEIPIAIIALVVSIVYYYIQDRRLCKKYYENKTKEV